MKKSFLLIIHVILLILLTACTNKTSDYQFKNEKIFSYKIDSVDYSLSKIEISNELFPKESFIIGYDQTNIYIGNFDSTFKIMRYDMDGKKELVYENSKEITISYATYMNNLIFIVESNFKEGIIEFQLKSIDEHGNIDILMSELVNKMPYVSENNNYLFINYSKLYDNVSTTYLEIVDINNSNRQLVDKRECVISDGGLYTGDMILYCGGLDNNLYYQIVSLNKEVLETEGKAKIYIYSFDKKKIMKTLPIDQKVIYVSGSQNTLITSEYSYEFPNMETGKIYSITENKLDFQMIPEISPGLDIIESRKINEKIIIYNSDNYYIYDTKKKCFYYEKYRRISENNYSSIKFYQNSMGYLEYSGNKIYFYKIVF